MSIAENEAFASLRILVALAQADGTIHPDERRSLAAALESLDLLPEHGLSVDALLGERVHLDTQLGLLRTEEGRDQAYRSAYFMAHADGVCSPEEKTMLDRIALAFGTSAETKAALERTFVGRASAKGAPSGLAAIDDPDERARQIEARVRRYAVLSGALGAFPIPGIAIATDLAVVALQLKMISDIGALWGHRVDRTAAKSFLYGVGLGTGARLAVANLAKLLPGWGSVVGATTSFVSTFALGRVMDQFFERNAPSGGTPPAPVDAVKEELRKEFKLAEKAARQVYDGHADVVIESQRANHAALAALSAELKAGTIGQSEFDEKVSALL